MELIIQWKRPKHVIHVLHKKVRSVYVYSIEVMQRRAASSLNSLKGGRSGHRVHKREDHLRQPSKCSPQRLWTSHTILPDLGFKGSIVLQGFIEGGAEGIF